MRFFPVYGFASRTLWYRLAWYLNYAKFLKKIINAYLKAEWKQYLKDMAEADSEALCSGNSSTMHSIVRKKKTNPPKK